MLLKELRFYFSSRFPPNRSPGFFFFKPSWLLLEFSQVSINLCNCGECIPAAESVEQGRIGVGGCWERGVRQGLWGNSGSPARPSAVERLSEGGCLSISSSGSRLWKTSFPWPGPSNNNQWGSCPLSLLSLSPALPTLLKPGFESQGWCLGQVSSQADGVHSLWRMRSKDDLQTLSGATGRVFRERLKSQCLVHDFAVLQWE